MLPEEGRTASVISHVVRHVDSFVTYMPYQMRTLFPLGLLLMQWGTIATLTALKPFTLMRGGRRDAYLSAWASSPFALFRALAGGLRGLILSGYYSMPSVYGAIGYTPDEHLARCMRKREELLALHGDGDHHTRSMLFEDIGRSTPPSPLG